MVLAGLLAAGVLVMDPDGWSPFGPAKWLAVTVQRPVTAPAGKLPEVTGVGTRAAGG